MAQHGFCPGCSRSISPQDTVRFGDGGVFHLDCHRPRVLSSEERALLFRYCRQHQVGTCSTCGAFGYAELGSDLIAGRTNLCPKCRQDLTESVRSHLYGCALLPEEVRRRAQALREAAQKLVKHGHELADRADVLMREAEVARDAFMATMRHALGVESRPPAR
jgi:hypothetical protein